MAELLLAGDVYILYLSLYQQIEKVYFSNSTDLAVFQLLYFATIYKIFSFRKDSKKVTINSPLLFKTLLSFSIFDYKFRKGYSCDKEVSQI